MLFFFSLFLIHSKITSILKNQYHHGFAQTTLLRRKKGRIVGKNKRTETKNCTSTQMLRKSNTNDNFGSIARICQVSQSADLHQKVFVSGLAILNRLYVLRTDSFFLCCVVFFSILGLLSHTFSSITFLQFTFDSGLVCISVYVKEKKFNRVWSERGRKKKFVV